ncbi:MAG: LysR substrate-binding domain-containing protein [Chitinophagales bacterium]
MNLQQFEYVLAVAEYRHFETAAEKCFVSQSTLSTMIARFEDEVGLHIFDRKRKPVDITQEGIQLIEQLKVLRREIAQLNDLVMGLKGELSGPLHLAVIPTIAPFLLPLFLQEFGASFPKLEIVVREETTEEITKKLKSRELDIGIVSTPLLDADLLETPLYHEPFVLYDPNQINQKKVLAKALKTERLCLMEEGHCMRTQVVSLCRHTRNTQKNLLNFEYQAGSIDGLVRFVKANRLTTLLPYLATLDFRAVDHRHLAAFSAPVPYRSVGLVVHRHFAKKSILNKLQQQIIHKVKPLLPRIETRSKPLPPI